MRNVFFNLCGPGDAVTVPAATTCLPRGPIVPVSVWSLLHRDRISEGWVQFDLFTLLL